jgi:hypothetical protein
MKLPVDTSGLRFVAAGEPEPDLDFETKAQRADDSGQPIFKVHLFAVGSSGRDVITAKVVSPGKGIGELVPVKVHDLVATTWTMGDRSGVSFKAGRIEAIATRAVS